MQAVRVVNAAGEVEEVSVADFGLAISVGKCLDQDASGNCAGEANWTNHHLCVGEYYLAIARGESIDEFTGIGSLPPGEGPYRVLPQSTATNAALAIEARKSFMDASKFAVDTLQLATCATGTPVDTGLGYDAAGTHFANVIAESYFQAKASARLAAKLTLAVADAQLDSSPSDVIRLPRAQSGSALSRAAAAHLLVGGVDGFYGSTTQPMCNMPNLTPDGRAAISLLRASGISPEMIAAIPGAAWVSGQGIDVNTLLNTGSDNVRDRLIVVWGHGVQGTVQAHSGLPDGAFVQAREFLAAEMAMYNRSLAATLDEPELPGVTRYAATVYPPAIRPPGYYRALAAVEGGVHFYSSTSGLAHVPTSEGGAWLSTHDSVFGLRIEPGASLLEIADYNYSWLAALAEKAQYAGAVGDSLAAVRELVTSDGELIGRLDLCKVDSAARVVGSVYGFDSNDGVVAVAGEAALDCATSGSIESSGQCDLSTLQNPFAPADLAVYPFSVAGGIVRPGYGGQAHTTVRLPPGRYYLMRPSKAGGTVAAGTGTLLTGFVAHDTTWTGSATCVQHVISPDTDRAVQRILEPSRENCAVSRVNCAGAAFDERVPLEDELSSDGDSVESSWRRYLQLAKDAAAESDRLGDEFVSAVLSESGRAEDVDLRQLAREERLVAKLQELQRICGTNIGPGKLLEAFGLSGEEGTSIGSIVVNQTPCSPGDTPPNAYAKCFAGRWIKDWRQAIWAGDSEVVALAKCVESMTDTVPYVHLGDEPLCAWEVDGKLCDGAQGRCPDIGGVGPQSRCEVSKPSPAPAGLEDKVLGDYLGFFSTSETLPLQPVATECDNIRRIRAGQGDPAMVEEIAKSTLFSSLNLYKYAKQIALKIDIGDYVSVEIGDKTFKTGSAAAGPAAGWPCAAANRASCTEGVPAAGSLFCDLPGALSCQDDVARAYINQRLYRAALVAMAVASESETLPKFDVPLELWNTGLAIGSSWKDGTYFFGGQSHSFRFTENGTVRLYSIDSANVPSGFVAHTLPSAGPFSQFQTNLVRGVGAPWQFGDGVAHKFGIARATSRAEWPINGFGYRAPFPQLFFWGLASDVSCQAAPFGWEPVCEKGGYYKLLLSALARGESPSGTAGLEDLLFDTVVRLGGTKHNQTDAGDWYALLYGNAWLYADPDATGSDARELIRGQLAGRGIAAPHAFPGLQYQGPNMIIGKDDHEALLDGLELLCEVAERSSEGYSCNVENAPVIQTLDDLDAVGNHIRCLGDAIDSDIVRAVFTGLPRAALSPLLDGKGDAGNKGTLGESTSRLRTALTQIAYAGPTIARTVRFYGDDVRALKATMKSFDVHDEMNNIKFQSDRFTRATKCIKETASSTFSSITFGINGSENSGIGPFGIANSWVQSSATCVDQFAQIHFADKLRDLGNELNRLEREKAIALFDKSSTDHISALATEQIRIGDALESAARELLVVENLKKEAERIITEALWVGSRESEATAEVSTGISRRRESVYQRYAAAHEHAKRTAFLARRAVEQRLGMSLESMGSDLPLVDAPATWVNSVCATSGIKIEDVTGAGGNERTSFADSYVGDYVKKLESVVESYRLEYPFHEGSDTAVFSVRDDVLNVRASCEVDSINLLTDPLGMEHALAAYDEQVPGWHLTGCEMEDVGSAEAPQLSTTDCITAYKQGQTNSDGLLTNTPLVQTYGDEQPVPATTLVFGGALGPIGCVPDPDCGYQSGARMVQRLSLEPGQYRYSWYHEGGGQKDVGYVGAADGVTLLEKSASQEVTTASEAWHRVWLAFSVPETMDVEVGFTGLPEVEEYTIAGPQLERVRVPQSATQWAGGGVQAPGEFEVPDANGQVTSLLCEDSDGKAFRAGSWKRGCVPLCKDGFSTDCIERATEKCYWETSFYLSQRDWEEGRVFSQAGFALGNFNYRIENIGLNFVGTGLRACSDSNLPTTCYANGWVPYSVYHMGPFFVRNHSGADFQALVFDGNIEHARGLASERYVSNPIGSADQSLLTPYLRSEFSGRPLDGTFAIRVWEDEGFDFNQVEDVQVVLNYRYWTRNN